MKKNVKHHLPEFLFTKVFKQKKPPPIRNLAISKEISDTVKDHYKTDRLKYSDASDTENY